MYIIYDYDCNYLKDLLCFIIIALSFEITITNIIITISMNDDTSLIKLIYEIKSHKPLYAIYAIYALYVPFINVDDTIIFYRVYIKHLKHNICHKK